MLSIAKFFGKSPFAPLQTHMDKVASCVNELPALFQAIFKQDFKAIEEIGKKISHLEHEADLTKNDIRNHLPKSLFLPVDRGSLLEILALQDALADQVEEIAQHAMMRNLELLPEIRNEFGLFCDKSIEVFWLVDRVMKELEDLLEASFGGIEAEKVKSMVDQIAFGEYETSKMQKSLLCHLYREGDAMPHTTFHLSLTLIEEIGCLAHLSEKLGNRVRMLLELK